MGHEIGLHSLKPAPGSRKADDAWIEGLQKQMALAERTLAFVQESKVKDPAWGEVEAPAAAQVETAKKDLAEAQAVGRSAEVLSEAGDRVKIDLLGAGREVANAHGLAHPFAQESCDHDGLLSQEIGSRCGKPDRAVEESPPLRRRGNKNAERAAKRLRSTSR